MKLDPLNILLNKDLKLNKNLYFIGGNEITLMEKICSTIIERYKASEDISINRIDTIDNFNISAGLFENKKIFVGKNCKGLNENNLNNIRNTDAVFVFLQENSSKTKSIKNMIAKDKESYLIDCYELNKNSKIKILNEFLKFSETKISKDLYWVLVEKLNDKYIFLENSLNKILELEQTDLTINNIKKILTLDNAGKEKVFFNLLNTNKKIVEVYKEKILNSSDVNDLYYSCRFFCNLILESSNETEYSRKIPIYLYKEQGFLIDVYRRYNSKKKKMLLRLLSSTENLLRKNVNLSTIYGLRFLLNIKKITIS
tara:strand:+ start:517 stop:1455 length:939 start_codon:yes stop_codon:yes gene_type:complete